MATAAAAIEDAITCCICFNVYRDPHALPCLHTLCKPCIDQLAVRGRVLECPECRESSAVSKIRKDFKTQSLIDAHNGKGIESDVGNSVEEICGMCREPGKAVNFHCKECEHFMCTSCEKTHNAIKVCRDHTVRPMKDIVKIAQSKLEDCVDQWKMEKTKITTKANQIEISIKSVQVEAVKQIELTNKHFEKLICDLEKKHLQLVKEIREANEVSVQSLRENKCLYDQLTREIQSKIHMLQEVIDRKHVSTMNNMVDDMDESLKEQVIQIRNQVDSFDLHSVVPVKVHIDKKATTLATGIKLEIVQCDIGTARRSLMLNSNYFTLKTNRYQLSGSQDCNNKIYRIIFIHNNIWCAAGANGIQIYDKKILLIKKFKHENYNFVMGLAEWRGDIIVACAITGLHQITQAGDYVQKITDGNFSDVSSNGIYVYGLQCIKPHNKIVIFTHESNKWIEKGKILLKTGKKRDILDKLIVSANSLFISLWDENCIEKYSLEGELQQTFGRDGTLTGGLNGPILSGVDVYDNVLVADVGNKQLKVYFSKEQTWQVVPVKLDLKPCDAVMDENNIWVVTSGHRSQMLKFTKMWCRYTLLYKILDYIILLFVLLVALLGFWGEL